MHAQCSICQELFENNDDQVVSALWCGHTFHNSCLNQWLENGRTCPSCRLQVDRRKIIQRLFFDAPEDVDDVVDDGRMKNEIDSLRLEVRRKEKEKNDLQKDKELQGQRITELQKAKEKVDTQLRAEQSTNSSHMKTLQYYESQQKSLELERKECKRIKQKLVTLQSMDVLLNGVESDAADIISSTGDGSTAVQTLSRQVAFLKREFEKLKLEKRQIKEHYDKLQMNELSKSKKIQDLTKERHVLQDQLERSEGDLKITEKHLELLKQKNTKLVSKLKKVTTTSTAVSESKDLNTSSFTDLLNDSSKMQAFSASTPKLQGSSIPKLSQPTSTSQSVDLDASFDLFKSPSPVKQQTQTLIEPCDETNCDNSIQTQKSTGSNKRPYRDENVENDADQATKYFKLTSASQNNSQKLKRFKSESAIKEANPILKYANMNIFKKRELGDRHSNKGSIVQKGFDGLGGHTTHINPLGNPFKKPTIKKSKSRTILSSKTPPLPKMDNFIVID